MGGDHCHNSNSNSPWMMNGLVPIPRATELEVDFESGVTTSQDEGIVLANNNLWTRPLNLLSWPNSSKFVDAGDENIELLLDKSSEGEESQHNAISVNTKIAKQKKKENRKAPKPPRPPQGPLLDAADHKLVQEITELAMRKRARAERIKMLKKTRAAKSSSWNGTLWALVVTVIFVIIIVFQGMCTRNKGMELQGSPQPAIGGKEDMISIEFFGRKTDGPTSISPNLAAGRQVSGSERR